MRNVRRLRARSLRIANLAQAQSTALRRQGIMRSVTLVFVLLGVSVLSCSPPPTRAQSGPSGSDQVLRRAFEQRTSNLRVEGRGVVKRILPDDNDGSRHQRFILELGS